MLSANKAIPPIRLEKALLLGELALDGRVRPIRGVLPAVLAAKRDGWPTVVVPQANLAEAGLVEGIEVLGTQTLRQLTAWLCTEGELDPVLQSDFRQEVDIPDLADVVGHADARFAVELAAAGAHHLMLTGPPGIGKTMLAQRLPGLLPPLTDAEALEVTAIHSVAGLLTAGQPLITEPPFVAPHHTSSVAALVGGGSGIAKPGAVSMAHRGVLFLDECAELSTPALEALRTPLEDGEIRLARRDGVVAYPARFQLVLAANPCPCAPANPRDCTCPAQLRRRYLGKLSGPLLDRVDLRVKMHPISQAALNDVAEATALVRERVTLARDRASRRWSEYGFRVNADAPGPLLRKEFRPSRPVLEPLRNAMERGLISVRALDRCLRVAWTLADLAGRELPSVEDVKLALTFRDKR